MLEPAQFFLAAQGLQGLHGFAAAQGLAAAHGLHGFAAAQGLHGLAAAQGFLAQQGLQGFCAQAEAAQGLLPAATDTPGTAAAMAMAAAPAARAVLNLLLLIGISLLSSQLVDTDRAAPCGKRINRTGFTALSRKYHETIPTGRDRSRMREAQIVM